MFWADNIFCTWKTVFLLTKDKKSFYLPLFLPPFGISAPDNLPKALHRSGLSPCFSICLVGTGGFALADYNSVASHFQFIRHLLTHARTHTHTHTHTLYYTYYHFQYHFKDIAILDHPPPPPVLTCP